jgi:PAS domain S-box-containing protein
MMTKVLIVDDHEENLNLLRTLLERDGYAVESSRHGAEALIKAHEATPDLIISDLLMPVMDGFTLLRRCKADERLRTIRFIVYTATYTHPSDEQLAMNLGADAFIVKPAKLDEFLKRIQGVLKQNRFGAAREPAAEEEVLLEEYNVALIRKLEQKMLQLEQANRTLEQDIAERKRLEEALRENEAWFRSLFENVAIGLYRTTPDGRILMANPALVQMLGYASLEEMQRRDLEKEGFEPGYSRELFKERLEREGHIIGLESAWTKSDGTRLWLRESALAVRDEAGKILYYEGTVENTSERKRAEEAHIRLTTAVEQSAETIVITDTDGTILYANPAFEKSTGYSREEAIGQNPRILKSGKQDAEFYRRMWALLTAGEVWSGHLINKRKDGTLYEEDATISPVRDAADKIVNYVAVKRDVTHEAELEKQLRQAQKMEVVGRLAGGVAHDFNNILMAISSYCELMMMSLPQDDPMCKQIQEILKAERQGASLTHQLLAFSRKQVLEPKVFDPGVVVSNMENLLQRLIGEDIDLRILTRPDGGMVEADTNQMEQVIMNLAINSRDAMPQGGRLTIEISNEELDEEYARLHLDAKPGPYVTLSITDTGHGMDPETLSHVFEPFFTTKDVEKGTGLGLATVYGIVTQSRGSISVYSEPGHGTTFKIYLPRIGGAGKGVASEQAGGALTGGPETILLVDDNESIRSAVGELMKMKGYNVLLAGSGKEALEISRNHAGTIDLLVTDVVMPEMSGRELAQQVSAERAGIKVLYMSGYTDDAVLRHGILSSDSAFLQKPAPMATLLRKIRELLG